LNNSFFKDEKKGSSNGNSEKEYIEYCLPLSNTKNFLKLTDAERNKLFKRCLICKNFKKRNLDAFHPEWVKIKKWERCERCKEEKKFLGKKVN